MPRITPKSLAAYLVMSSMLTALTPALSSAYQARLTWTAVGAATGYKVYVRPTGSTQSAVTDVGAGSSNANGEVEAVVSGVQVGVTSTFWVTSYGSVGAESPASNLLTLSYAQVAPVIDSDGDGLTDAQEDVNLNGVRDSGETDANNADTDSDGLTDGEERQVYATNPLVADSDGDGDSDGLEVANGSDPRDYYSSSAVCGNGIVEAGELCDDGAANSDLSPDGCQTDCRPAAVCGDPNDNGTISVSDGLSIMRTSIGLEACSLSRCDVDGNGEVTVNDAAKVVHAAVGTPMELDCTLAVTLVLQDGVDSGTVELLIDSSATGSGFVGEGSDVRCQPLLDGDVTTSFDNDQAARMLRVTLTTLRTIEGPAELAVCRFRTTEAAPDPADFAVEVLAAPSGTGGSSVPNVSVQF